MRIQELLFLLWYPERFSHLVGCRLSALLQYLLLFGSMSVEHRRELVSSLLPRDIVPVAHQRPLAESAHPPFVDAPNPQVEMPMLEGMFADFRNSMVDLLHEWHVEPRAVSSRQDLRPKVVQPVACRIGENIPLPVPATHADRQRPLAPTPRPASNVPVDFPRPLPPHANAENPPPSPSGSPESPRA